MPQDTPRSFDDPDEVIHAQGVRSEIVNLGGIVVARNVHEPGWRWSSDVRPLVSTDWCEIRHVGYVLSGWLHLITRDGGAFDFRGGDVFHFLPGHDAWVVGEEPFITVDWIGARSWLSPLHSLGSRILVTLVVTDIVDSTRIAGRMGAPGWNDLISAYQEGVRDLLARFGGSFIKSTGDGMLAMFDGTARAIRCSIALRDIGTDLGVSTRTSVHTGEVEISEGDVHGLTVHEAVRIVAAAQPGDILVSASSRLLAGDTDIELEDRGEHELKGLEGARRLYAVMSR